MRCSRLASAARLSAAAVTFSRVIADIRALTSEMSRSVLEIRRRWIAMSCSADSALARRASRSRSASSPRGQFLAAGDLLARERQPLLLQLRLHLHLLQFAAQLAQAGARLYGFRVEPLDLALRLGARGLGFGAQLRHCLLADIARRGISGDLDLGEFRTAFDAIALLDLHARNESGGRCGCANETLVGDEPARDRGLARVAGDRHEN